MPAAVFYTPAGIPPPHIPCTSATEDSNSLFGDLSLELDVDSGGKVTICDPGSFFEYVDTNAWFEGHEVILPREDRIYLLGNLTGGRHPRRRKHRPGVPGSAPRPDVVLTVDDGEIEVEAPDVEIDNSETGREQQDDDTPVQATAIEPDVVDQSNLFNDEDADTLPISEP